MRSRMQGARPTLPVRNYGERNDEKPENFIPYESPNMTTQDRFEDEPEPTEKDFIVAHYLKHHPLYEFRNLEEFHIDGYRHWLHARVEYYNTETYPAEISHWEKGSKACHMLVLLFPIFGTWYISKCYKDHLLKQKNVKMPIVGVFSQISI